MILSGPDRGQLVSGLGNKTATILLIQPFGNYPRLRPT